jgi:hypothetical protein
MSNISVLGVDTCSTTRRKVEQTAPLVEQLLINDINGLTSLFHLFHLFHQKMKMHTERAKKYGMSNQMTPA